MAHGCYQRAIELFREVGDRYNEASSLHHLGDLHADAGDPTSAREVWAQALAIFDGVSDQDAADVRAKLKRLGPR
jgi:predicted negative regulator of RcsB-dependent stress response